MMEAAGFFETLVKICHTTWHHIPKDINLKFPYASFWANSNTGECFRLVDIGQGWLEGKEHMQGMAILKHHHSVIHGSSFYGLIMRPLNIYTDNWKKLILHVLSNMPLILNVLILEMKLIVGL
jgi:hypothetical protein